MKQKGLISIVLTLYNKAPYIEETIFSIYKQTYTNWELIIVDDCSTDGSLEIAKSFCEKLGIIKKCKFIKNEKNLRVAKTFERGLKEARGDRISMCDGDDILMKNKLEENLSYCIKNNIDFCHSDLVIIDENNNFLDSSQIKHIHLKVNNNKYNQLICSGNATGSSIFFSKEIGDCLKKDGFPNQDYQDRRAVVYTSIKNYNIGFIKKPLVYYRRCKSCITRNAKTKSNNEILQGRKKIFGLENTRCNYIIDKKIYINNKQKNRCSKHVSINNLFINYLDGKKILIPFKLLKTIFYTLESEHYYRMFIIQARKLLTIFNKS